MAFVFWGFRYPYALAYHEQFQFFLFDGTYFCERLAVPGGLAQYIAEFFVQMYNNIYIGAAIVALMFVVIQLLSWMLMKRYSLRTEDGIWYPFSFLIPILIWALMGDPQVMYAFPFAVILTLFAMIAMPRKYMAKIIFVVIIIPVLYWLAGPVVLVFSLYAALSFAIEAKEKSKSILIGVLFLLYSLFCIIVSTYMVPYSLSVLFRGLQYYRFPDVITYSIMFIMLIMALASFSPLMRFKYRKLTAIVGFIVVLFCGYLIIPNSFDSKVCELMDYDFMVRKNDWKGVIRKAENKMPDLPMSVCATNLALGMTDQLDERGFQFFQNGTGGLFPPFEKNFTALLTTAEVYYQLGLVNSAQRLYFESMECLPDYNKSVRVMKRLAETNIINGQYNVARKYLLLLKRTLCYSRWAERTMKLLGNEKAINSHPIYGKLRRYHLRQDFLFSEDELDKICGLLFLKDNDNKLAMQYMLFYPLLQKNINKFMQYYMVVNKHVQYMPAHCQEAEVFAYSQNQQSPPQGTVSPIILQQFSAFAQTYSQHGNVEGFRNTVWYYLTKQ